MNDWDRQWIIFGVLFTLLIGWILSVVVFTNYFGAWGLILWGLMFFLWFFTYDHMLCNGVILNSLKNSENRGG